MDEMSVSRSPPQPAAASTEDSGCGNVPSVSRASARKQQQRSSSSVLSRAKRDCSSFAVSLQEGFRYIKALLLGQAKKMTARDEKEATEADLQTYKTQVDAADAAEDAKKKLDKAA